MTLSRLAAAFLLALFGLAVPAGAEEKAHKIESEHYLLVAEGDRAAAEAQSRLLEAAWHRFKAYFKKAPKLKKGERLQVRFFLSRKPWAAALRADGADPPVHAGGYYWPASKTAYLYRQPTQYYTRVLLVHEACHQFHYLARTKNKNPATDWYAEGMAEFLSWHHWDGKELSLGVQPHVSLKDYAAQALKETGAEAFDLKAVVEGKTPASRAVAWSLVRYMHTGGTSGKPLRKLKDFLRKMDAGASPGPIFRKVFGAFPAFLKAYRAWLQVSQQPWAQVFNEWFGIGPKGIRGVSDAYSVCRLKQPASELWATLVVPKSKKAWRAGVMLHYTSPEDFSYALLDWGGFIHIGRRQDGRFRTLEQGEGPPAPEDGKYRLHLFREKEKVFLMVGKQAYGPWELPGRSLGLAVRRSDVEFREITWK